MSGFTDLGSLLAGGAEPVRQDAFFKGQLQRANVEHLSAQTQDALAQAKVSQMKAKQAQTESDAIDNLADALLKVGSAKTPEEAQSAATIIKSGKANFPQYEEGMGHVQNQNFRSTLGDPNAPQAQRLGASSAIEGKLYTKPADKTDPSIEKYNFSKDLNPAQHADFDVYAAPPKFVTAGGVPYQAPRGGKPATAVVSPEETARNAAGVTGAKTEAAGMAKRTLDLPAAKMRLANVDSKFDRMISVADKLDKDEGLWKAVGLGKPLASIPGTEGARVRALLNTLRSQAGFAVLQDLRDSSKTGGAVGNVSDYEQKLLQSNITALDDNLAPEDLREQLKGLIEYARGAKDRVHGAFSETYPELSGIKPGSAAPASAPAGGGVIKWGRDANGNPVPVK